ncbi:N/A [soil metagenome]
MTDETSQAVQVLVVEDSADQAGLLRQYFERAGCAVTTVVNAEEAIAAYLRSAPDLAFIDLFLPGMDGWELIKKIKADLPHCAVAVTSVLDAADFPDAEAILPKPFTGAQVRQVLSATVPRWRAR